MMIHCIIIYIAQIMSVLESQLQFIPLAIIASLFFGMTDSLLIQSCHFATIILSSTIIICISVVSEFISKGSTIFNSVFNWLGRITYVFFIFGLTGHMINILSDYEFNGTFFVAFMIIFFSLIISVFFPLHLLLRIRKINRDR